MEEMEPREVSAEVQEFAQTMKKQVVGQDAAVDHMTSSLSRVLAGIHDPERPVLTMLFLGPTGVGKTETVRALAELLFDERRAFTRINCQEYSAQYNLAKLLGSPPGYVGGEITPILAQEAIERPHRRAAEEERGLISRDGGLLQEAFPAQIDEHLSLILFDEVEKAHPKLWDLLLGLLEDGTVVLGNNEETDFRRSIVVLTSNVGSEAMGVHLAREGIGFDTGVTTSDRDSEVERAARRAARRTFPQEFLNRFDATIVFKPLRPEHLSRILDNLVARFHLRSLKGRTPFLVELRPAAKDWLIEQGYSPRLGARPLQRLVETQIVTPLSEYLIAGRIGRGDLIVVDTRDDGLHFLRQATDLPQGEPRQKQRVMKARSGAGPAPGGGEEEDITEDVKQMARTNRADQET